MNNNSSKQILLSVIGVAILVVAVVGVSFAFFSYVRTGNANTIETGTIVFSASDTNLKLTNVFPTDGALQTAENEGDVVTATVKVGGKTTYDTGIDYQVRVVELSTANATIIPTIEVVAAPVEGKVTATVTNAEYNPDKPLANNQLLCSGTIAGNVDLTTEAQILTIKAYYSKDDYHISDSKEADLISAGLIADDYTTNGGEIITTSVWNALSESGAAYSFKIQVIATQNNSGRLPA